MFQGSDIIGVSRLHKNVEVYMQKEELIKLAEALASVGYEISKLDYKQVEEPPFYKQVELTITCPLFLPKKEC